MAGLGALLVLFLAEAGSAPAMIDILKGAEVRADPKSVSAILATFDRAEEALQAKSITGMTAVYSKNYQNRGLRKEDTSRVWGDIFSRYDRLSSRHLFSRVVVDKEKGTAHVTCTGALFGKSSLSREGSPVQIDVWFEAVHHLVFEDGGWKIVGHDPAAGEEGLFGSALHLLF
jgi:hypothetical protein